MPNAGPLRRQAEREFYYRQLGGSFPLVPVQQLERNYYLHYLGAHVPATQNDMPLRQLFTQWAKQYISDKGGIPPVGNFPAQLWRQVLIASGFGAQSTRNMNDNAYTFYLNN